MYALTEVFCLFVENQVMIYKHRVKVDHSNFLMAIGEKSKRLLKSFNFSEYQAYARFNLELKYTVPLFNSLQKTVYNRVFIMTNILKNKQATYVIWKHLIKFISYQV